MNSVCFSTAHHPPGSPCWPDPEKGTCNQKLIRYFHNHEDDKCEQFIYSGCGGNANNFKTHDECHKECSHTNLPSHSHSHSKPAQ
ncbi:hypothetical protein LSTR_LSTR017043 [Laodelphax striatellus]|uniref:BPTI/Kunitz inhibitor domain-containing protein n=1 Tax=Laodelphax striatellus TaxID=195883 RepID=A0A482XL20_LAOST|nr:hypothetical protein LSTR_LSTR017043 [Laodelphax striatellus]